MWWWPIGLWGEGECTCVLMRDSCIILGESTMLLPLVPGSLGLERNGESMDGKQLKGCSVAYTAGLLIQNLFQLPFSVPS